MGRDSSVGRDRTESPDRAARSLTEGVPFAIQALDQMQHDAFSRWVKVGVASAAGAYAFVTLLDVLVRGFTPLTVFTQGATVGLCLLALWLAFGDRLELAATLTIGAIWLELHGGLLSGGMVLSSTIAMPTVIVGAGLLWGGRGAYALAAVTTVSFPGLALISHRLLGTPVVDGRYEVYLAVLLAVVMFVAAGLIDASMRVLQSVVVSSLAGERRVAELVRHAPDGIMALDKDGTITSANPTAERLLDAKEEDLIGTSVITALRARLVLHAMSDLGPRELLESGPPMALEFSAGEGSVVVDATTTLFQRRDGSEGLQLTLHDATGRVRAYEAERVAQARLEERNRLDSVGRLAGGVAHDFNNHLTVIGGSAEMLLSEAASDTEDLALSILEAKTRAAKLTTALLMYARRQMISPSELAIDEVVVDCEPLLKSLVGDKVRLEILTEPTPPVMADRHQIEQCLVNLLANAKDALSSGGVARVYTAGPGSVSQSPFGKAQVVPEGFVEFRGEDDGSGMDETTMAQAFEPFFTTSPFGERTGLGLSMVQGVVSQNGGGVVVESRLGAGTCVRIRWPVYDPS